MADLIGLAADLEVEEVRSLLLNRRPDLLDETASPAEHDMFVSVANGIATEVRAVVGDPAAGSNLRVTAVWAVCLGTAYMIEAALFPEQQLGEHARSEILKRRYDAVMKLLGSLNKDDDGSTVGAGVSRGEFPDPTSYPDPARPAYYGMPGFGWGC